MEDDLAPIWARNGQSLVGGAQYGPRQGADAIEWLAATIEERGAKVDADMIRFGLEPAVYSRRDNAAYLRETFTGEPDIKRAADLFDQAADDYEAVLNAVEDDTADHSGAKQIAVWLRDAAAAEREAGLARATRRELPERIPRRADAVQRYELLEVAAPERAEIAHRIADRQDRV